MFPLQLQGTELLVEEGVRSEITCQAQGRPQPEVMIMYLKDDDDNDEVMMVMTNMQTHKRMISGDHSWNQRQYSWPELQLDQVKMLFNYKTKWCQLKLKGVK